MLSQNGDVEGLTIGYGHPFSWPSRHGKRLRNEPPLVADAMPALDDLHLQVLQGLHVLLELRGVGKDVDPIGRDARV